MLTDKDKIKLWLDTYNIINYSIEDDLTVNVDGTVKIGTKNLTEIPIQFGIVNGDFCCHGNDLTSLKGCPTKVGGYFNCSGNNLKSLEFCPLEVGNSFFANANQIESLEYSPLKVGASFSCGYNPIKNLNGFKTSVGRYFEHEVDSVDDGIPQFKSLYRFLSMEHDMEVWMLYLNQTQIDSIQLAEKLESDLITNSLQLPRKTKV